MPTPIRSKDNKHLAGSLPDAAPVPTAASVAVAPRPADTGVDATRQADLVARQLERVRQRTAAPTIQTPLMRNVVALAHSELEESPQETIVSGDTETVRFYDGEITVIYTRGERYAKVYGTVQTHYGSYSRPAEYDEVLIEQTDDPNDVIDAMDQFHHYGYEPDDGDY